MNNEVATAVDDILQHVGVKGIRSGSDCGERREPRDQTHDTGADCRHRFAKLTKAGNDAAKAQQTNGAADAPHGAANGDDSRHYGRRSRGNHLCAGQDHARSSRDRAG